MVPGKRKQAKDEARCKAIRARLVAAKWDQEAVDEWCADQCLACFDPSTKFTISRMEPDGGEDEG